MESGFEWITPERATADLENQIPNNRPLVPAVAAMYARVQAAGRWEWDSPDGLIYDTEGRLFQGQHRLKAIVINGVRVKMWVTRNAPMSVASVLDSGKGRTVAHRLHFEGHKNAKQLAAVGRLAVLWEARRLWSHGLTPAREEIIGMIEKYPDIQAYADLTASWPSRVTLSPGLAGFTWWILGQIDTQEAFSFMGSLRSGANLGDHHPIHVLRERLIRDRDTGVARGETRVLLTFLAWRAYLGRDEIIKLQLPSQVNDDTFRRVLGLQ